jgi:hypothetical protein
MNALTDEQREKLLEQTFALAYGATAPALRRSLAVAPAKSTGRGAAVGNPLSFATPKPIDWEAVCEPNRQHCNRLSKQERRRLREEALRIVFGEGTEGPRLGA